MKADKKLESLFEAARQEKPKLSFESAAERFESALPVGPWATVKAWIISQINLNTFLLLILIAASTFWLWPKPNNQDQEVLTVLEQVEYDSPKTPSTDSIIEKPVTLVQADIKAADILTSKEETTPDAEQEAIFEIVENALPSENPKMESGINEASQIPEEVAPELVIEEELSAEPEQIIVPPVLTDFDSSMQKEDVVLTGGTSHRIKSKTRIDNLVVGGESIRDPNKIKRDMVADSLTLEVKRADDLEICDDFIAKLNQYGVKTSKSAFKEVNDQIQNMTLQLQHTNGLKLRIHSKHFTRFRIRMYFDANNQLIGLSYSFNERAFSRIRSMKAKGRVNFIYKRNTK